MADLAAITEIFPNAEEVTNVGVNSDKTGIVIPFGDIPSFASGESGRELALGLVQAVTDAIVANANSEGAMSNLTVTTGQQAVDADTLRKTYNFVFNLGYGVDGLDVEAEPTPAP